MIAVGKKAPEFELQDADAKTYLLSEQITKGPLILVFFRSGDWWPPCQRQLVELQTGAEKIAEAGSTLWAVSYDSIEIQGKNREELKVTYPLLSDEGSRVIDTYGIRNTEKDGTDKAGLAHPMTLIIDKKGIVRAKLAHDGHRERHGVADILAELKKLKE